MNYTTTEFVMSILKSIFSNNSRRPEHGKIFRHTDFECVLDDICLVPKFIAGANEKVVYSVRKVSHVRSTVRARPTLFHPVRIQATLEP